MARKSAKSGKSGHGNNGAPGGDSNEKLARYEKLKKEGNLKYVAKDYKSAKDLYTKAIEVKDDEPIAYSNRAACYLQQEDWYHALYDCNKAIEIDPKFSKAYFRRASALRELARFRLALEDYKKVVELDGANKLASKEAKEIEELLDKDPRVVLKPIEKPEEFRCKKPMKKFPVGEMFSGNYNPKVVLRTAMF